MARDKTLIGWRETVSLPDLGLDAVNAKIDTGARTSALHVDHIEQLPGVDGEDRIRLFRHGDKRAGSTHQSWDMPAASLRKIKSSNGTFEFRYVIDTELVIGPVRQRIELTLTDRRGMRYEMLIGRTALRRHFIINAGRSHIVSEKIIRPTTRSGAAT